MYSPDFETAFVGCAPAQGRRRASPEEDRDERPGRIVEARDRGPGNPARGLPDF